MLKETPNQIKIIDFFKNHPGQNFYLRELARELNLDPGNLSRELNILHEQGQLLKITQGNLAFYSLRYWGSPSFSVDNILRSESLRNYLKKIEPELIKFTQTLIRTPSVAGVNPEEEIAQLIFDKAKSFDLTSRLIAKDRRRPNLIIDLEQKPDPSESFFLFLGHLDTIGPGSIENWSYYPFSGHVAGGRIYGRGAADMKAGLACELFTLKLIHDLKIDLPIIPRLLLVSNEEGGSTSTPIFDIGMEYLLEEGWTQKALGAIYGYGGTLNVGIGHRGVLRARVTTQGEAIHTGNVKLQGREKSANAVTAMAEILLSFEKIKLPPTKHPSFPNHSNVITPGTMILHGGTAVSTIPDFCESVVEVRFLPGLNIKKVYHQLKEMAEKIAKQRGVKVELERFVRIPAVSLSPSEKIVQVVATACEKVYGQKVSTRGYGPANESFMLIQKGIPTVVFGPLGGKSHADNEFIYTNSLIKTLQVYLLVLLSYV